jgi:ferric-dicitrate binding protein FerR (iron transport regulator)
MNKFLVSILTSIVSLSGLFVDLSFADNAQIGTAVNAVGTLVVVRPDGIQERLQGKGSVPLYENDVLKTDTGTTAMIEFTEGIQVALNENTQFRILSRWEKDKPVTRIIRIKKGEVWAKTQGGPRAFEVETPVATAAIKETEFDLKVQDDGNSVLTVIEGVVVFGTAFGTCPVKPGTISYGVKGKKCTKPAPTDVKPAIAWTSAIVGGPATP